MGMQNDNEIPVIERASGDAEGNSSALKRLLARRFVCRTADELLRVGEAEDGADADSDEVEIAGGDAALTETKAAPAIDSAQPQPLREWTDADLDAMTADFSADDVKESLALRSREMREILEAKSDE